MTICDENREPTWVGQVLSRLAAQGYTVAISYDGDGYSWQNAQYTVTKEQITYAQNVRAQYLLRIPIG